LGEYQPRDRKKQNVGQPIANYYPPVVDEDLFYRVQKALDTRGVYQRGRKGQNANLFTGLIYDSNDGSRMNLFGKGGKDKKGFMNAGAVLLSRAAAQGRTKGISFPYHWLEKALLSFIREITVADMHPVRIADNPIDSLQGKLAKIETNIGATKKRLLEEYNDELADVLKTLTGKRDKLLADIEKVRQETSYADTDCLAAAKSVLDMASTDPEARVRLKALLPQIISRIDVLVTKVENEKKATVTIHFRQGHKRQIVVTKAHTGLWSKDGDFPIDDTMDFSRKHKTIKIQVTGQKRPTKITIFTTQPGQADGA